jgi:hypothetical protein
MFTYDALPSTVISVLASGHVRVKKDAPGVANVSLLAKYADYLDTGASQIALTSYFTRDEIWTTAPDPAPGTSPRRTRPRLASRC